MAPTPHALALAREIAPMLATVQQLARGKTPFDPARAQRSFTLMGSDYVQFFVLPRLCAQLEARGADVVLDHRPANPGKVAPWMESGQVDLGIGYLLEPPPSLRSRLLLSDRQVCLLRQGHPAQQEDFTLERYAALSHVAVSPGGAGIYGRRIDALLKTQGVRRNVVLTVPSFLAVPYVVARTDYIATVPSRFAQYFADLLPLRVLAPPIPLPAFEMSMFWHERVHHDLANSWLRQEVVRATADLAT
jgi:DNA-binding transcriptional LysR family regulator